MLYFHCIAHGNTIRQSYPVLQLQYISPALVGNTYYWMPGRVHESNRKSTEKFRALGYLVTKETSGTGARWRTLSLVTTRLQRYR